MQRSIELLDKVLSEYDEHETEGEGGGGGVGLGDCGSSTEPSIGLTPDDESPSLGIPFFPNFFLFSLFSLFFLSLSIFLEVGKKESTNSAERAKKKISYTHSSLTSRYIHGRSLHP